ncbi:NUDIX domain-containing protein [Solibacillus sp. FSL W8-0372]|uniref:NUDIX hydrolase n=1 Tax=Solibacillus sp. FSL W8-0372 TaxID=2921713 RepID=UPI0030CB4C6E
MNEIKVVVKGVLIRDNRILIIKRSHTDSFGAGTWEVVGGNLNFGESLEEALKREFLEEVGLRITVKSLLFSTTFFTSNDRQIVLLSYLCESEESQISLSSEHEQYLWASKEELLTFLPKEILADYELYDVLDLLE